MAKESFIRDGMRILLNPVNACHRAIQPSCLHV